MHDQPKYSPLEESSFFPDNTASRSPVPGTVARGHLRDDELLYRGTLDGQPADVFPFPIDEAVMGRTSLPSTLLGPVLKELLGRPPKSHIEPSFIDELTPRQLEVLQCLAEGIRGREGVGRFHDSKYARSWSDRPA